MMKCLLSHYYLSWQPVEPTAIYEMALSKFSAGEDGVKQYDCLWVGCLQWDIIFNYFLQVPVFYQGVRGSTVNFNPPLHPPTIK